MLWALWHYSQLKFTLLTAVFSKPLYAVAVVVLILLSMLANAFRWHRLNAAQNITLHFSSSLKATYVGIAFNTILPGNVGGDFVRCFQVMKHFPNLKSRAIMASILDRVCGLMGIAIITSVITLFYYDRFLNNPSLAYIGKFCFALILLAVIGYSFVMLLQKKLSRLSLWQAIDAYRKSKLIVLEALTAAVVTQLLLLLVIILINDMMGLPKISAYIYMSALAIAQIANLIPLTPGGVGIGEAAFANVILLLQPHAIGAYATVFLAFRLFLNITYLPGAIIGITGYKNGLRRIEEQFSTEVSR